MALHCFKHLTERAASRQREVVRVSGVIMNTILNDLNNLQPVNMDAGQVFSGKPSGTLVKGYAQPLAYPPAIDPSYIFHMSSRDVIVWFLDP